MDSLRFTYENLKTYFHQRIESGEGPSLASWPNLQSALQGFLTERGIAANELIGSTLRASYYKARNAHLDALAKQGRPQHYIANRKSALGAWHRALMHADRTSSNLHARATPFQSAIQELIGRAGSVKGLARSAAIPTATLLNWSHGAMPNQRSAHWATRLERHFGLATGALTDLLPRAFASMAASDNAAPIAYRQRLAAASREPYWLRDVTDRFRAEWRDFLTYKVALGTTNRRDLKRSKKGRWSVAPRRGRTSTTPPWYASHHGAHVPTAAIAWSHVSAYLGFLKIPADRGGLGMSDAQAQSLSHFARDDLLEAYVEWRTQRSGGIVHGGIATFLQLAASITHPETGYLTQTFERHASHIGCTDRDAWQRACRGAFAFCREYLSMHTTERCGARSRVSRDSFEPIRRVLELPNPVSAIADAVVRLRAQRPHTGGALEAIWARDLVILQLFASNPLRLKNMQELTWNEANTGELHRRDGKWRIAIDARQFKNFAGAARDRAYDMQVRPEVWPDLERYLTHYRPMLAGPTNPYVFVADKGGDALFASLGRRVEILLRRYLDGCPGAGPHSFRHIVATTILKANPNAWNLAAMALHDKEDTVRQHYAHLGCDDAYRLLDETLSSGFRRLQ